MKRALISVSDKTGILDIAQCLVSHGYSLLSTGGTKKYLEENKIDVTQVSSYTGFDEILDGRVKTLHPKIHAGLLAKRDEMSHMDTLRVHEIDPIDFLVVNLYPFEETIKKEDITKDEAIEQIDIGGPSMLRSAAKNFDAVTVITDVKDYELVIRELDAFGLTSLDTRSYLAQKVFELTSRYDFAIATYLLNKKRTQLTLTHVQSLRYGENPHQLADLYQTHDDLYSILHANILHGKQLSYNNIRDANAAINILSEFNEPCAVALKHMNPCGVGVASSLEEAFDKAYQSDDVSIFGGIVAFNRKVDLSLAKKLNQIFLEIIIAPSFESDALNVLMKKKNIRILELAVTESTNTEKQLTTINGGMLIQDVDHKHITKDDLVFVTNEKPSEAMIDELLFAWNVVKHVKSNAIVLSKNKQTVGIGAGQMNRVGACEIALNWASSHGHTHDICLASDAFFPFDDIVKLASEHGVSAIIQPGGSMRDEDSISLCNQLGIPMVFTGIRHFKH
ncbi:MAG: bifunctional phosphoribosylaminoimidazolecarboxamide formyltransferase/IMP cyclohydrolase [Acholeplasmataceae bacterium]|jgi:phosphoribosylaminoimidazolecarboxamide formyltransferase/IMP cyclohydrolase|nr:bifunctional phosphoribosylaminoimidazolecarboxamide formyltransferase/IMP cyclohydrolase [Acholeplasmataceae bacterium]